MDFLETVLFAFGLSAAVFGVVSLIAMAIARGMTGDTNAAWHEHQRSKRFFNRW